MLMKITNMCENWNHEGSHREANIKHSGYVSPLSLLLKDHKQTAANELPPTRPVVSANEGLGTSISNIISEIIEPLADSLVDKMEVISTEDFLHRVDECNKKLEKEWTEDDLSGWLSWF